jgi:hypothetical protein
MLCRWGCSRAMRYSARVGSCGSPWWCARCRGCGWRSAAAVARAAPQTRYSDEKVSANRYTKARRGRNRSLNDGQIQTPSARSTIVPLSNFVQRGFGFVYHSIAILFTKCQIQHSRFTTFFTAVRGQCGG